MKLRKFLYTFLLVLFSLILVADIALYLFIPERSGPVSSSDMPFPGGTEGLPSFSFENEDGSGFSFSRPDGKSLDNPFANGENPFADGNSSFSAGENPFSESERMGADRISAVSFVGNDGDGWELTRLLEERGIDTSRVIRSEKVITPSYIKPLFPEEGERLDLKNFR